MKLINKGIALVMFSLILVFSACGMKKETTTFKQIIGTGTIVSLMIEHEGDKITKISSKTTFDNEVVGITDEEVASQFVDAFQQNSKLEDVEIEYSEKETTITYKTPEELVNDDGSFKEIEKQLTTEIGFEKENK